MSRYRTLALIFITAVITPFVVACGGGGARRSIPITQTDDGCTPASISLTAGEKVTFAVKNDGKKDREIEGIDGTAISELLVPSGRTRTIDYTAPSAAGTGKIKCYIPAGNTTIIELVVSGQAKGGQPLASAPAAATSLKTTKAPQETVNVKLLSYEVAADKLSVSAGATKFVATNSSTTDTHELAVLRVKSDGSYDNTGEIEDIAPGKSGELTLDLPVGKYLLACLLVPGQAGSKVDHFKSGMKLDFEVK